VFGLFLTLVCLVAVLARQTLSSNLQSQGIHNFLAEEGESPYNKSHVKLNMVGQGAWDDVREWLQSVFHRRLYSGNGGAAYFSDGATRMLPMLGNNLVVGHVQVRQLRLKTLAVDSSNECKVPAMIARLNPSCYPHFSTANEETDVLSEYLSLWETENNRSATREELPWAWSGARQFVSRQVADGLAEEQHVCRDVHGVGAVRGPPSPPSPPCICGARVFAAR
jgi:hypothetical protein